MYEKTKESFGILPIPVSVVNELDLQPHVAQRANQVSPYRHNYLASQQQTCYAVIHIHTAEERRYFRELFGLADVVQQAESKRWVYMARKCCRGDQCNGIFYKVCFPFGLPSLQNLNPVVAVAAA